MLFDPLSILKFFGEYDLSKKKLYQSYFKKVEDFKSRKLSFDWIHAGKLTITIGELTRFIQNTDIICPPRTGHLGNWQEIFSGRGGALNHNDVVCGEKKLGYPLIVDFNQTENINLSAGDTVYLPGSIIKNNIRNQLPLLTWNNKCFKKRSRESSYFTPFVVTEIENQLVSLANIHRNHCSFYKNVQFISTIMCTNKKLVKDIACKILEEIQRGNCSTVKTDDIIDRKIYLDGRVVRDPLKLINNCYTLDEERFSSVESLIEAAFIPFEIANDSMLLFDNIKELRLYFPFFSLSFIHVMYCVLKTHLTSEGEITGKPFMFNPHLHWGAYDSAGYPPISKGYFRQKIVSIRNIYNALMPLFQNIEPALFILLPSAIFNLLPPRTYINDYNYIDELFSSINKNTSNIPSNKPQELMLIIKKTVSNWIDKYINKISSDYMHRFSRNRCIYNPELQTATTVINMPSFDQLTIQKASMILGSLHELALSRASI